MASVLRVAGIEGASGVAGASGVEGAAGIDDTAEDDIVATVEVPVGVMKRVVFCPSCSSSFPPEAPLLSLIFGAPVAVDIGALATLPTASVRIAFELGAVLSGTTWPSSSGFVEALVVEGYANVVEFMIQVGCHCPFWSGVEKIVLTVVSVQFGELLS